MHETRVSVLGATWKQSSFKEERKENKFPIVNRKKEMMLAVEDENSVMSWVLLLLNRCRSAGPVLEELHLFG